MILEARAANCFSSLHVLKLNGVAWGKFEGRWFSEALDIQLTGRRRLRLENVRWLWTQFVLSDTRGGETLGQAQRAGLLTTRWDLDLRTGPAQLVRAGWFATGYVVLRGEETLAEVNRLGLCERGWEVRGQDDLEDTDLLLAGLVYHIIRRRESQQSAAHAGGT
ncbi:MAG: hypothetical protein JO112_00600 [Planctomycetes bacterium]|nr:hypothetical protein [Planctomycetota bacterium]